jgi:hypothetical protein
MTGCELGIIIFAGICIGGAALGLLLLAFRARL